MKFTREFCALLLFKISLVTSENVGEIISVANENSTCVKDKCIMKCCDVGKVINKIIFKGRDGHLKRKIICDRFNETELPSLDATFDSIFIHKPNLTNFEIKPNVFEANRTFKFKSIDVTELGFNLYLNENAEVLLEMPNAYDRWKHVPRNIYCIDTIIIHDESDASRNTLKPGIWAYYIDLPDEVNRPTTTVMIVGMLLSCFFLLLVLVVYSMLPELRNLCGLILMAYVGSQLAAFLMLVVMKITSHEEPVCEGLTYAIYFFFLASFCWMNVMSFDIWWTFRGYAKARPIHRRGERFKFFMYCLYAFGVPLAMAIALGVLNNADLTHMPWFITPKIQSGNCFMKDGEKFLYLYVPMLILILTNWMLFILTAVNIWRLSRGTAVLDSRATGSSQAERLNRRRFIIYLKLSVVMGLNWLLELMSYTSAHRVIWFISDCYNVLIGVFIFVIFICKRKILKKLKQRFARNTKSKWYPGQEETSKSITCTDMSLTANCTVTQEANTTPLVSFSTAC